MIYYSSMRKEGILPFSTTWMDLEYVMLNEISQTEKDKYCISLTYGISNQKKMFKQRNRELNSGYQSIGVG